MTEKQILSDYELWSLLYGYGPEQHNRGARNMTNDQRLEFLFDRLRAEVEKLKGSDDVRLVLQITHHEPVPEPKPIVAVL